MRKLTAFLLAMVCTLSMSAAIQSKLGIYMYSDANDWLEEGVLIGAGDSYAPFNAANCASYFGVGSNTNNYGVYAVYQGGNYSELYAPELVNIPLVVITSAESAAKQGYSFYIEWNGTANNSQPVYLTDLRAPGGPQTVELTDTYEYAFDLSSEDAYVEGTKCVIADRFVINYNYVNLKGDFDNPNGGGAWIWLNDFVEHGETATKEYTLPADAWCHFQVVENGVDYADSFDFDESNKSHQFTTPGWSEELTLHTAEAGVYTFTWNYVTNTLTIDFPAPAPPCVTVRSGLEVGRYYTICLPKNVVASDGASFWTMSNRGADVAYLVEETGELAAGKPYIFQAEAATLCVTYGTEEDAAGTNGALVGTFVEMNQAALNNAVAANDGSDIYLLNNNALWKVNGQSDNHLAPNRAYIVYKLLDYSVPNHVPGRRVRAIPMQGQGTTGVENLNATEAPVKTVIDGKLYIIRGEHMFDATGRMVK